MAAQFHSYRGHRMTDEIVVQFWFGNSERQPSDKAVREATFKYIADDYLENMNKYCQADRDRLTRFVWSNNK